jgi:hypothetical protein
VKTARVRAAVATAGLADLLALHLGYPIDAIMCGDTIVWISRDHAQHQLSLLTATGARGQ